MGNHDVQGDIAAGWDEVAAVLQASIDRGDDTGASVAVYHRGARVVDVAGGSFTRGGAPYDRSTLQLVFSTTKGITAIAVAMCVERGLLDYDERVATYWPEFAAAGKGDATVAQLLSHQLGLFTVEGLTLDQALDWDTVTAALAAKEPEWPIGSTHGYHAITYGWLAGELVRRVDGRSLGTFVADEIAAPLGVELWIGLPESEEHRVSPLIRDPAPELPPEMQAMVDAVVGPGTNGGRALSLSGAFGELDTSFNSRAVHAAELPAANGITTAAALAKVYAATLGPVDGVQLLQQPVRDRARTQVTPEGEADACLMAPTTFGMGFMVHGPFTLYSGPGSYGHPGAGGSVAFADPGRELAMSYVMNTMATNLAGDTRAQQLIDAAVAATA
jgi:CubicO group peptidase (beta-lactamase class C family)